MDNKSSNAVSQRHILFDLSPIDPETDELEEKTKSCYQNLKQMINGKSPKERHETYTKFIAANPPLHTDELTMGLLVAILVEQECQNDYYGDVVAFSKDNLNLFATHLNSIITERLTRLSNHSTRRIFWITRQLIKANVAATDNTCSNLIRQTAKGDLSPRNLFMAENLIELLCDTRNWLISTNTFIGPTVIFNTMRLIMDHSGPAAHKALRKRETDFVIGLIRERFEFVLQIGKDFLRLLHHLNRMPEFQSLSHDIYVNNPKQLSPKYDGPHQLLALRTPRRLFQSCLTYEMERKIQFLATGVNFGNQKRYQDWFTKQFLSGAESTSLRCDLIRYICTVIHPSNEVLCSNIIPRWAIIGWLLTTSIHVINSCRLALFLDWLAYDQTDNIMNIEPAILLMTHSIRAHPQVTSSLLEFLCRAPTMFHPKIGEQIRFGIRRSLQQILEKRVLQSLKPIFSYPKYDPVLKALIKETFPEYCQIDNGISPPVVNQVDPAAPIRITLPNVGVVQHSSPITVLNTPTPSMTNPIVQSPIVAKKYETPPPPLTPLSHITSQHAESPDSNSTIDEQNVIQSPDTTSRVISSLDSEQKIACNNQTITKDLSPKAPHLQSPAEVPSSQQRSSVLRLPSDNRVDLIDVDSQNDDSNNELHVDATETPPIPPTTNQRSATSAMVVSSTNHTNYTVNCSEIEPMVTNCTDKPAIIASPQRRPKLSLKESTFEDPILENKIQFPCMKVDRTYPDNILEMFGETISQLLEDLNINRTNPDAISELLAEVDCIQEFGAHVIETIGDCLANSFARDFTLRIYPSYNCDTESLKKSISSPLFNLCAEAFSNNSTEEVSRPMALLAYIGTVLKSTGFLVIYYLRGDSNHPKHHPETTSVQYLLYQKNYMEYYFAFNDLRGSDDNSKPWPVELKNHFEYDLRMMYEYDPAMLSMVLPLVFSIEFAGKFETTNNERIVRLAMSALDPICMSELLAYTMTGTTKVVSRDVTIQDLIKFSLDWPSWEQLCLWKLIAAQNVPIENYLPVLDELSGKQHAEAVTSIMLNLQKIQEPDAQMVEQLISSFCQGKELSVVSVLRYWAMKTDIKSLVKHIVSLLDQPQVKRKGQPKNTPKPLSVICYKTLGALDHIHLKAPKNRIFNQSELFDGIALVEPLCDDMCRKKFARLFDAQPKPAKKKKLEKET